MRSIIDHSSNLEKYGNRLHGALEELRQEQIMARIWAKDHTVWKTAPTGIIDRLGWLHSPGAMADQLQEILDLTASVRRDGYTQALLMGMGGSSLAPEVFRKTFGVADGYLDLGILDSTDPEAVLNRVRLLDPTKTLLIVSTKSGGTVETFSFLKYFYNWILEALGPEEAGRHCLAITDPGSGLAETADRLHFRHIFFNDPDIGGRYSALSFFGLVPAALVGLDVRNLLARAARRATAEKAEPTTNGLNAAVLGTILGELAKMGRNKLTLFCSQEIMSFGDWLEQLVAESTGKDGQGIVPIVGETLGPPDHYGSDRLFVAVQLAGDTSQNAGLALLEQAGHPVIRIELQDVYDLGEQFFLWELATAVAGARLDINPFDQPDVESAKVFARQMVATCQEQGRLPEETPDFADGDMAIYGKIRGTHPREILNHFLATGVAGDYVAIQAYLEPTPVRNNAFQHLRFAIRDRYRLATTVGYGPRFLHSTGQLHKGDAGQGLFLQITADDLRDAPIPDEPGERASGLTFGILKAAQALGDRRALLEAGRRVLRLHLKGDVDSTLQTIFS